MGVYIFKMHWTVHSEWVYIYLYKYISTMLILKNSVTYEESSNGVVNYWFGKNNSRINWRMAYIWVSQDCHNKFPQTRWLKTTGINLLTVLGDRSLTSRYQQGWFLPEALRRPRPMPLLVPGGCRRSFMRFGLFLQSSGRCLHHPCLPPVFSIVCLSSPFLIKDAVPGFRPTQIIDDDLISRSFT